jgi:hypothetical protein
MLLGSVALASLIVAGNAGSNAGNGSAREAGHEVYTNEKFGYSMSYPQHWAPSGITYANAFEIRNHAGTDSKVPEKNRASLIVVDTLNDSADVSRKFVESYLAAESTADDKRWKLQVGGQRAVRIHKKVRARSLGPGTLHALGIRPGEAAHYLAISTYVAHGRHVLSMEGVVPIEADPEVVSEIDRIQSNVTFVHRDDGPEGAKGATQ